MKGKTVEKKPAKRRPSDRRIIDVVNRACTLATFAVHEHYNTRGTKRNPQSDPGWDDSYVVMEECELLLRDLKP